MILAVAGEALPQIPVGWWRAALMIGAAAGLGLACYAGAFAAQRAHRRRRRSAAVEPIDPARELGSASFDAPLLHAAMPGAARASADADLGDDDRAADLAVDGDRPVSAAAAPRREFDLAEFAALPGRNAVWVEDALQVSVATRAAPAAIEKLRAVPPASLSLCEMVERFAAALQDYQAADDADPSAQSQPQREAVLNEALKALALITGDSAGSGPIRRDRSGAA